MPVCASRALGSRCAAAGRLARGSRSSEVTVNGRLVSDDLVVLRTAAEQVWASPACRACWPMRRSRPDGCAAAGRSGTTTHASAAGASGGTRLPARTRAFIDFVQQRLTEALAGAGLVAGSRLNPGPQPDQRPHHHKGDRQCCDAADVPGQAAEVSSVRLGISRSRAWIARAAVAASSSSLTPTSIPIGFGRVEEAMEPRQVDPPHPHPHHHLNGQGREPQRLEDLLEGPDLSRTVLPQRPRQLSQIQHRWPPGPDRGGEGMHDHQQREDGHGSTRTAAPTMGAIQAGWAVR